MQDFVAWGYISSTLETFSVEVNGFTITAADIWKGDGAPPAGDRSNSLQRHGTADHDHASDWAFVNEQSKGTPNEDLAISIPDTPKTGVGFNLGSPGFGDAVQTDVAGEMHGVNASLWTRIEFGMPDPALLRSLSLEMRYNDGFVAYLNGEPVASNNAPESLPWNSSADDVRSVADSLDFEPFDLTAHIGALHTGNNVLVAGVRHYFNRPRLRHEGKSLEAVWHRATLDLLAAIALIDRGRFVGRIVSYKAGHALDCDMMRELYCRDMLCKV